MNEMRLVEVAARRCNICPIGRGTVSRQVNGPLKTLHTTEQLRRDADLIGKYLDNRHDLTAWTLCLEAAANFAGPRQILHRITVAGKGIDPDRRDSKDYEHTSRALKAYALYKLPELPSSALPLGENKN